MKKVQSNGQTVKANNRVAAKKAVALHSERRAENKPTVAEVIEDMIFSGETDPERRAEILEVWRQRNQEHDQNLFQPDVLRLVTASIRDRDVEVFLPVKLSAPQWQKLIVGGMDAARARWIQDSANTITAQWQVPDCGAEGVLAMIVRDALRKAIRETPQTV